MYTHVKQSNLWVVLGVANLLWLKGYSELEIERFPAFFNSLLSPHN